MRTPSGETSTAAIGLGANLGDRAATIDSALSVLGGHEAVEVHARSPLIETDPVGPQDQPPYLNGAALLATTLDPFALLGLLLATERAFGRDRARETRWGPRTLDLDLLLYGDLVIDADGLTVPHPRMLDRAFVLEPLGVIAPGLVIPAAGAHPAMRVAEALEALRLGDAR